MNELCPASLRVNESKPSNSFSIMTDYPVITKVPFIDRGTGKGQLRSCEVIKSFQPINHDMMVLKTYKWYATVHVVMPRLIGIQRDLSRLNF